MALPYTPLNIDVLDEEKQGLYPSFGSTTKITAPMVVRENGLYLAIRAITANQSGTPPWSDVNIASATVSASIDNADLFPSQGYFYATFGANSTPNLIISMGASNFQNALNALASISAAGGVTVVPNGPDLVVTFNLNGAQSLIAATSVSLYPASNITTIQDQAGTSTQPAIQSIRIQQLPATYQSTFSAFLGAGYTCTILTAGGSGINNLQLLTLNPVPYAGTWTITTTYGTSGPLQFSAAGSDLQAALNAIATTPAGTWIVSGGASGPYEITNTTGTSISALTATLTGLSVPIGMNGELSLATPGMVARFNALPPGTQSFDAFFEVTIQFPGQDPQTILMAPVTVLRNVIRAGAITTPPYPVGITLAQANGLYVQTLFGIVTALSSGAGTLSGIATASGATTVPTAVLFSVSGVTNGWFFRAGTDATGPIVQRPDDFNATTNAFVWEQFI